MSTKTRIALIAVAAVLVLVWGMGMGEGDKKGGYSDETNYYSAAELREREKVIAQMAEMRGETPPPTATPKPEKKEKEKKLDERFEHIRMQELPQSFTLKKAGYDAESGIMLAEYNMTGLVYAYYDVPQEEWDKLINAESFDKWFEAMIMNKYKFEQIN